MTCGRASAVVVDAAEQPPRSPRSLPHSPASAAAGKTSPGSAHRHRLPRFGPAPEKYPCAQRVSTDTIQFHSLPIGGTVVAMGLEEDPKQHSSAAQVAADLAALSARVETLERQIALLRQTPSAESPEPTPPPPIPDVVPARVLPRSFAHSCSLAVRSRTESAPSSSAESASSPC